MDNVSSQRGQTRKSHARGRLTENLIREDWTPCPRSSRRAVQGWHGEKVLHVGLGLEYSRHSERGGKGPRKRGTWGKKFQGEREGSDANMQVGEVPSFKRE